MASASQIIDIPFREQEHNVLCQLNAMWLQGQLCDVTVRVGTQEFRCHQAVLSASSVYFHSIFVQGVLCFPEKPTVEVLDLSIVSADVFFIILNYIYTANLKCAVNAIPDVLQAAKDLEIRTLVDHLLLFMGASQLEGMNQPSRCEGSLPSPDADLPASLEMNTPVSLGGELSPAASGVENVVVKQEVSESDPVDTRQDMWSDHSTGLPAVPFIKTDSQGDEEEPQTEMECLPGNSEGMLSQETDVGSLLRRYGGKSKNTVMKTQQDLKVFMRWLHVNKGERRALEKIPPRDLDPLLVAFFTSARKKDGSEYEPRSLASIHSSLERYLKTKNYPVSITLDREFSLSQEIIAAKQKFTKAANTRRYSGFSREEIDILYQKGLLGTHSAEALLNTLWLNITVLFGVTRRLWHRHLKWGDITLKRDVNGLELLVFNSHAVEDVDTGMANKGTRQCKAYAAPNSNRCPVLAYKCYRRKRPDDFSHPHDPFYLAVNKKQDGEDWFLPKPLGMQWFYRILTTMCADAGLKGRFTSYGVSRTPVAHLYSNGINVV